MAKLLIVFPKSCDECLLLSQGHFDWCNLYKIRITNTTIKPEECLIKKIEIEE